MTLRAYLDGDRSAAWVKLTEIYVAVPEAAFSYNRFTNNVTEAYIPLIPRGGKEADRPRVRGSDPVRMIIVTTEPRWLDLMSKMRKADEKTVLEVLIKNMDTLVPSQPMEGMIVSMGSLDSKQRSHLRETLGGRLASNCEVLRLGGQPPPVILSLLLLGIGVVVLLGFAGVLRLPTPVAKKGGSGGQSRADASTAWSPAGGGASAPPPAGASPQANVAELLVGRPADPDAPFISQRLPAEMSVIMRAIASLQKAERVGDPDGVACFSTALNTFGSEILRRELRQIAYETGDLAVEVPRAPDESRFSPFGTGDLHASVGGFFLQVARDVAAGRIVFTPRGWTLAQSQLELRVDVGVRLDRANDLWHLYRRGVDAPQRQVHGYFTTPGALGLHEVLSATLARIDEAGEALVKLFGSRLLEMKSPPLVMLTVPCTHGQPGETMQVRGWATETATHPHPQGIKVWRDPNAPHEYLVDLGIGAVGRRGGKRGAAAGTPQTSWIQLVVRDRRILAGGPVG